MPIQFKQLSAFATEKSLAAMSHVLFVMPSNKPASFPYQELLETRLKRARLKYAELAKTPMTIDLPNGAAAAWVVLGMDQTPFQRLTLLRKAIKQLLEEKPQQVAIALFGDEGARTRWANEAVYTLAVNAAELPTRKGRASKSVQKTSKLRTVSVFGCKQAQAYKDIMALVHGNTLARTLTMLPPNELTPSLYREKIQSLAKIHGWKHQEFDMKKLKKMGAGAFVAVAQGSDPQDAAIVHLTYQPKHAKAHAAIVGKGICFDTGGHNLKSARYMNGMHEDMNGSAVALGMLVAATEQALPIKIDCWVAIAQNHIGPLAYKQNDVITALNGKTIEIVHTDAEGRMVLADTLTLASREKPSMLLDFATLTGSMVGALGNRYSGVLGNRPEMLCKAVGVGATVGERVSAFPFDEDYDEELDSSIADIKQCTIDSEADHILAARFLYQFIEHAAHIDWLHVDLSCYNRKGGLGAVESDVNGFGVAFGLHLLKTMHENQ